MYSFPDSDDIYAMIDHAGAVAAQRSMETSWSDIDDTTLSTFIIDEHHRPRFASAGYMYPPINFEPENPEEAETIGTSDGFQSTRESSLSIPTLMPPFTISNGNGFIPLPEISPSDIIPNLFWNLPA